MIGSCRRLSALLLLSSFIYSTKGQIINTIRIELPTPANPSTVQILTLCEVQVVNARGELFNLTSAVQSSTRSVGPEGPNLAEWAIDGDTSSNFNDLSCSHTAGGTDNAPFWAANFASAQPLGTLNVVIYNRNVLQGRLGGADVSINGVLIGTLGNVGQNPDNDGDDIITIGVTGSPTASPTTSEPTPEPTDAPTESPSLSPTNVPTSSPTRAPSRSPTHLPTALPTDVPSMMPSRAPTIPQDDFSSIMIIAGPAGGGTLVLFLLALVLIFRRRKRSTTSSGGEKRPSALLEHSENSTVIDIKNPMYAGDSVTSRVSGTGSIVASNSSEQSGLPLPLPQPRVANRASLKGTTIPKYSEIELQEQSKKSAERMIVVEDFQAEFDDELTARQGTILTITSRLNEDWYHAYDPKSGKSGIIPLTFLQKI